MVLPRKRMQAGREQRKMENEIIIFDDIGMMKFLSIIR
jgi:hypothetical protein